MQALTRKTLIGRSLRTNVARVAALRPLRIAASRSSATPSSGIFFQTQKYSTEARLPLGKVMENKLKAGIKGIVHMHVDDLSYGGRSLWASKNLWVVDK
jgi:hypothetical protein